MAGGRCAETRLRVCKARWARLRVHGAGSVHRPLYGRPSSPARDWRLSYRGATGDPRPAGSADRVWGRCLAGRRAVWEPAPQSRSTASGDLDSESRSRLSSLPAPGPYSGPAPADAAGPVESSACRSGRPSHSRARGSPRAGTRDRAWTDSGSADESRPPTPAPRRSGRCARADWSPPGTHWPPSPRRSLTLATFFTSRS